MKGGSTSARHWMGGAQGGLSHPQAWQQQEAHRGTTSVQFVTLLRGIHTCTCGFPKLGFLFPPPSLFHYGRSSISPQPLWV